MPAAELLSRSEKWLYRHAKDLPFARRIGRDFRFELKGLRAWQARQRVDDRAVLSGAPEAPAASPAVPPRCGGDLAGERGPDRGVVPADQGQRRRPTRAGERVARTVLLMSGRSRIAWRN